jgi:hypothetical protein
MQTGMREITHDVDVAVIGGGLTGLCAALAAARHGAKTALIHDRPVLGGGASSESRVHICGADRCGQFPELRETGILEELALENLRRNHCGSYSIWDSVLYEKARFQDSLSLFLNSTCLAVDMSAPDRIASVTAWQMTTQTYHHVRARVFVDASGDAILAPLTGATTRAGREARSQHNESHAPETASPTTMGMTCLFGIADTGEPQSFDPPACAYSLPNEEDIPYPPLLHGGHGLKLERVGIWWIELGGNRDSIHDAEEIRDELYRVVWGVWDHMKNHCVLKDNYRNHVLDWIQFLPTKRESRRYEALHMLTQNDIESGGHFPDVVAYGGWEMDDHNSGGFHCPAFKRQATIFFPTPTPYGISFRSLCSRDIGNLMVAGRCAGFTHMALSSARVMATCSVAGQAAGTAAAMCTKTGLDPARFGTECIEGLQQALIADDCWLPGLRQVFSPLTTTAKIKASCGDPEVLRNGLTRPLDGATNRWDCRVGDVIELEFAADAPVGGIDIVFDSDFNHPNALSHHHRVEESTHAVPPPRLVKAFHVDRLDGERWQRVATVTDNCRRLVQLPLAVRARGIRIGIDGTWGAEETGVYSVSVHSE